MLRLFAESSMKNSQIFVPASAVGSTYYAATAMVDRFETYCDLRTKYTEAGRVRGVPYWVSMRACQLAMGQSKELRRRLSDHSYLYTFHRPEDVDKPAQVSALALDEGMPVRRIGIAELQLDNDIWLWLSHINRSLCVDENTIAERLTHTLGCAVSCVEEAVPEQMCDDVGTDVGELIEQNIKRLYSQAQIKLNTSSGSAKAAVRSVAQLSYADEPRN